MKIYIGQINPTVGALHTNAELIIIVSAAGIRKYVIRYLGQAAARDVITQQPLRNGIDSIRRNYIAGKWLACARFG